MSALPDVAALLPHRGPAILLDEVVESSASCVRCRVAIRADSPYVEGGRVPGVVAIEWMAQAAAVFAGLDARAKGEEPRIGFLLGTRELLLGSDGFDVGETLDVAARHVFGDERLGAFECSVAREGEVLARATLNVYLSDGGLPP